MATSDPTQLTTEPPEGWTETISSEQGSLPDGVLAAFRGEGRGGLALGNTVYIHESGTVAATGAFVDPGGDSITGAIERGDTLATGTDRETVVAEARAVMAANDPADSQLFEDGGEFTTPDARGEGA